MLYYTPPTTHHHPSVANPPGDMGQNKTADYGFVW
jgi:hypothetical protein